MSGDALDRSQLAEAVLAVVARLVGEVHPGTSPAPITLDSSLDRDLGLDSLTRVELLARLEQTFEISLPERVLASAETPRDLLRGIEAAGFSPPRAGTPAPARLQPAEETERLSPPEQAATLVEALQYHAELHPDRLHIRFFSDNDEGETITYGELWREAGAVAAGLQHMGLAAGDRVLLMLPTGRDYFLAFAGVLLAGGAPVPIYPPGRPKQIEEHLRRHAAIAENSQARLMITVAEAQPFARLMRSRATNLTRMATTAELQTAGADTPLQRPALTGADLAFLQYTSGSTGMPKGVILNHANLLANIRAMGRTLEVTSDDVFVSWLPLYHDMGLIGAWLGSLYYGCPLVLMSPLAFLTRPIRWLQAISRHGGTLSAAPNFAYEICRRRIEEKDLEGIDLSTWRGAFNGAEAVSPGTIEAFREKFARCGFRPGSLMPVYGLAENSVGLAFPPPGRGARIDRVSRKSLMRSGRAEPAGNADDVLSLVGCGLPLMGHQIRIVDEADRELPERQEGHVQFLGPSATSGYFRNPTQTAALFHGPWLDTGDLGYLTEGELFITGRSKDIVIKGGRNIYPVELEEEIGRLESVRTGNVAVFGAPDREKGTERLVVLAETRKRKPEELAELRAAIIGIVADLTGEPPDEVILAPPNSVPKTSSGKIRRRASRELYESGRIGRPQRAVWLQLTAFALTGLGSRLRQSWRRLASLAYAGWCWLLFGLAAGPAILGVMLLPTLAARWRWLHLLVRLALKLAGLPLRIEGSSHLPGPATPCLLVANHASYLDAIILAGVLHNPCCFVAKAELRRRRPLGWLLARMGTEFVERFDREKGLEDSRRLAEMAGSGRSLFFFPEGTLKRMPGLLSFRLGGFVTAVRGNLPVVPLVIRGSRSVLRGGSWFPRRGLLRVEIGEPLDTANLLEQSGGDHWRTALELSRQARAWILTHCGEPDLAHERPELLFGNGGRNGD
jgi:acyl carrier protein